VILVIVASLAYVIDLSLGTPDLAEGYAHRAMSWFPESWLNPNGGTPAHENAESSVPTPWWLRLGIGMLLCWLVLTATFLAKWIGNENPIRAAQQGLAPGDHRGWRMLSLRIWRCRLYKLGYLAVMGVFFCWLYFGAVRREMLVADIASQKVEKIDFRSLGSSLLETGGASGGEATATGSALPNAAAGKEDGAYALGDAAIYMSLWLLHALLIALPLPRSTIDLPLATFNPHRSARKALAMQERESSLLRGIVARIQTTPAEDPLRTTLITLSEPVASAVNELFNRVIMPLPAPEPPVQSSFTYDAESEEVVDHPEPTSPERSGPNDGRPPRIPDDMEDPGRIIFG
jgi:hypothetical protein